MDFRDYYDRVIEMLTTEDKATEIMHAKIEFFRATGKMHGDEPSFECRMAAFFDWYIFDRKENGITPLEAYLAEESEDLENERDIYEKFLSNVHSIFIVKKTALDVMNIRDLYTMTDYSINNENGSPAFFKGAIFEGRIFPFNGEWHLSPALSFHPKESTTIIKHLFKVIRKRSETDIIPLIHRLAYMNLKWETYRNIKVVDIYKFDEYGKVRWWDAWL